MEINVNKKFLWLIVIAVAAAVTISAGLIMYFRSSAPNPAKMTGEQIMKYVQSPDFNNMPRESRREFFKEAMDSRVNTYFGLSEQEKTPYLDKVIDEMSAMRSQMQRPTSDPNRRFDPNTFRNFQNMKPAERRAMREQFDPEQMARTRIFFNALRARAQERGIQMGGFGGGRGGR
jgi:hypothetical protein